MGIHIKGIDMPPEGQGRILLVKGTGEVSDWFDLDGKVIASANGSIEKEDERPRRIRTNGMVIMEKMERMDVPWRCTMMNELKQKIEISIDAEWWNAEYKEGEK